MKVTTRGARDLEQAAEMISTLDPKRKWRIEVSEFRIKRTNPQNRLLWAIYTGIANMTGHTPEEVHEACKAMFLPPKTIDLGEKELQVPGSSAELDVAAFSDYVERVQSWAATELGVRA